MMGTGFHQRQRVKEKIQLCSTLFKILEEEEKESRMILYPKQFAEEESEIGKVDCPRKVKQK